jgi:hypothetical protein
MKDFVMKANKKNAALRMTLLARLLWQVCVALLSTAARHAMR